MQEPVSIPTGGLPDGWVESGDATFQCPADRVEVRAVRRSTDDAPSALGVGAVWAIEYTRAVGEATERETVETATTYGDAVERLCACMRRLTDSGGAGDGAAPTRRPSAADTVVDTASYTDAWVDYFDSRE